MFNFFKKDKKEKRGLQISQILNRNEYINYFSDEDSNLQNLDDIRAVARERVRKNGIAHAYIKLAENNVVGKGFKLKIDKNQNGISKSLIKKIEKEFDNFCKNTNIDVTQKNDLNEILRILTKVLLTDGEILAKIIRDESINSFGLALQLLDVDRLNTDKTDASTKYGIEVNEYNRPIFYHLRSYKNSIYGLRPVEDGKEDAKNIIHAFRADSSEQTRGKSALTSALILLKELEQFESITVKAAQVGTLLSAYVTSTQDFETQMLENSNEIHEERISLAPGGLFRLRPGEQIQSVQGNYPTAIYESVVLSKIKRISRALELSPTFLANEWAGANYAVARFMSNEDRAFYVKIQAFLIKNVLNRIFDEFLKALVVNKNYDNKILDLQYEFVASAFNDIDLVKIEQAKEYQLKLLSKSHSELASEDGKDFSTVIADVSQDIETAGKTLGLSDEEIQAKKLEKFKNIF